MIQKLAENQQPNGLKKSSLGKKLDLNKECTVKLKVNHSKKYKMVFFSKQVAGEK